MLSIILFVILLLMPILLFFRKASKGKLKGILGYTEDDKVSTVVVGDNR